MSSEESVAATSAIRPAFWSAAGAVAALPLLHLVPLDFDRAAALLFAPFIVQGFSTRGGGPAAPIGRTDRLCLITAAAAVLVSTLLSPHLAAALALLAAWSWTLAIPLAIRRLRPAEAEVRVLLMAIAAGCLVGIGLVAARLSSSTGPMFPVYGNARLLGLHLLCGSLALMALLATDGRPWRKRLSLHALALPVLAALFWTGGRAPLLGIAAAGLASFSIRSPRPRLPRAGEFFALTACALALSLAFPPAGAAMGVEGAWARSSAAASIDRLSSGRIGFWGLTLEHAMSSPWLGHGADAYNFLRPKQDGNQPHNFLLQWFVDFGVLGAAALGILVVRAWLRGWRRSRLENVAATSGCGWIAVTGLLVVGLFDGVFYHAIVLLPTALLCGLLPSSGEGKAEGSVKHARCRGLLLAGLGITGATLVLHQFLFVSLLANPPESPRSFAPQMLRIFPSTTNMLWRWLESWKKSDPETALEWARWGQRHSNVPALYHDFAGRFWIERGNLAAAEQEYRAALLSTHHSSRAHFERILALLEAARAERDDAAGPPPTP